MPPRRAEVRVVWVHVDGRLVPEAEARVSVFDRGFLFGDGIFESVRAVAGVIFRLDRHLDRLAASAAAVEIDLPVPPASIAAACRDLLDKNRLRDARLRITVTRGLGRPGDYAAAAGPATLVISGAPFVPLPPEIHDRGVEATISSFRQAPSDVLDPAVKSTSRLGAVLARREAKARGAFEAILLDAAGRVTEGTASNVFLVAGGHVLTPPAPEAGLPGVTREAVIALARDAGLPLAEQSVPLAEARAADEIFLTNTSWDVLPVARLDGRPVGAGVPGPAATLLLERYRDLLRRECARD